jgi:hypothetical protein
MNFKMKAIVLVFGVFACSHAISQDTWIQRDSVGGPPKSAAASFALNHRGYCVGGIDQFDFKRKCYKYNITTDNWSNVASLGNDLGSGLERASAVAFATYSKGYVGLGQGSSAYFGDFWSYDPVADVWTQVADFGGTARTQAVAFCIDEIGYVGTGLDATGYKKDFYKYDPVANTWTPVSDFGGTARRQAVGFSAGAQGYVGTGDDGTFTKDFWQYLPLSDTWIQKADFGGTARYGASGFGIFPKVFIGTGYDNTLNYTNDFWEYNYWNDTWTQRANLPGLPRANCIAFALDGYGFMGAGYDGTYKDDFWYYTPLVGIEEINNNHVTINLFPNPVSETLVIDADVNDVNALTIYDNAGHVLFSSVIKVKNFKVDCSAFESGIYYCAFKKDDAFVSSRKFVVQK